MIESDVLLSSSVLAGGPAASELALNDCTCVQGFGCNWCRHVLNHKYALHVRIMVRRASRASARLAARAPRERRSTRRPKRCMRPELKGLCVPGRETCFRGRSWSRRSGPAPRICTAFAVPGVASRRWGSVRPVDGSHVGVVERCAIS